MSEKTGKSILRKALDRVKRIALFFLKLIYIAPFFALGLWLLSTVYLQGFHLEPSTPEKRESDVLKKIIKPKDESVPRGHFHITDAYIKREQPNQPVCVICHGTYAHSKEKSVRSILNMHDGYIACAVCHTRQDIEDGARSVERQKHAIEFLWVDGKTGEFSEAVKGEYGKYSAMIYPIEVSDPRKKRIFTPITEEAARQFLKTLPELTPDQVPKAREKLHESLSKKPVFCSDCHKKQGYLDYQKLGFPKQRVDHLISNEFVGMIEKYKTFYLPSVIDFRGE